MTATTVALVVVSVFVTVVTVAVSVVMVSVMVMLLMMAVDTAAAAAVITIAGRMSRTISPVIRRWPSNNHRSTATTWTIAYKLLFPAPVVVLVPLVLCVLVIMRVMRHRFALLLFFRFTHEFSLDESVYDSVMDTVAASTAVAEVEVEYASFLFSALLLVVVFIASSLLMDGDEMDYAIR